MAIAFIITDFVVRSGNHSVGEDGDMDPVWVTSGVPVNAPTLVEVLVMRTVVHGEWIDERANLCNGHWDWKRDMRAGMADSVALKSWEGNHHLDRSSIYCC